MSNIEVVDSVSSIEAVTFGSIVQQAILASLLAVLAVLQSHSDVFSASKVLFRPAKHVKHLEAPLPVQLRQVGKQG